jgi:hypothetical protein
MCSMEACSVCECDDHEVPPAWMSDDAEYCQSRRRCLLHGKPRLLLHHISRGGCLRLLMLLRKLHSNQLEGYFVTLGLYVAVNKMTEESAVDRSLGKHAEDKLGKLVGWAGLDNPWRMGTDSNVEYSYINLLRNPERYTGYAVCTRSCASAGRLLLTALGTGS